MAAFVKYQTAIKDAWSKVHDMVGTAGAGADVLKVMLSNTAPDVAAHTVRADVGELSTGNGYTSGGALVDNVGTMSAGVLTVTGTDVVWTANTGSMGPFRYVILYNDTAAGDPLLGYWDYGSSITLNGASAESFTTDFGSSLFTSV